MFLNQRLRFVGLVDSIGFKTDFKGVDTSIITIANIATFDRASVVLINEQVFNKGANWSECSEGDIILFYATVSKFKKSYKNLSPIIYDYRLERPANVVITANKQPT
jgi:hypothetical protein